ncbi:MAG: peptidoglycan-binding domain-containing protein [bacterium]|nr:peptidoglycan-binding domain-containing protein [bacterium]
MKKILFIAILSIVFLPLKGLAFFVGETQTFNVEPVYDSSQRQQLSATLRKTTTFTYFYFDDSWWSGLSQDQQNQVTNSINNLGEEFDGKIYPLLTQNFGQEWTPGIDRDTRITILFHPMKETSGGYFNSGDEYPKAQSLKSNEREMIYINANSATSPLLKSFLAHEFQHLINFNQKERLRGVTEDVWLNEAKSEYTSTLLGYDNVYDGSNLERRVRNFLDKPYDSLTEWRNQPQDYGIANLFIQYLVDHYGIAVLKESALSSKTGIESLNEALKKLGAVDDFSQIFTNWAVAVFINSCNFGSNYCYLNQSLRNFKVVPQANFLPPVPKTSLSVVNTTKGWAANWYKFFGIKGDLSFEFAGSFQANSSFKIPYLIEDKKGAYTIDFLNLNNLHQGKIEIEDFDKKFSSLVVIPLLLGKTTGFSETEPSIQFSWTASANLEQSSPENQEEINRLLAKIEELKQQIKNLQIQLIALGKLPKASCQEFSKDLYYGMTNSDDVKCLQQFLKSKGETIYPEGLASGNYLSLTTLAVKRYQASKGIIQTGYFGPLTRAAANKERY